MDRLAVSPVKSYLLFDGSRKAIFLKGSLQKGTHRGGLTIIKLFVLPKCNNCYFIVSSD